MPGHSDLDKDQWVSSSDSNQGFFQHFICLTCILIYLKEEKKACSQQKENLGSSS